MNRRFYVILNGAILSLVMLVSACGGSGSGSSATGGGVEQNPSQVVNGVTVPPIPDATQNAATVAGVDSNSNGVRDDIDRYLAEKFGNIQSDYALALAYVRTLQTALVSPSFVTTKAHVDHIRCISDETILSKLDAVTKLVLDTPARRASYAEAFAGVEINISGCQ